MREAGQKNVRKVQDGPRHRSRTKYWRNADAIDISEMP